MRQLALRAAAGLVLLAGCGINKSRLATEQLVVSDAVDRAVAAIDFTPLSGKKVFFDTQYLEGVNMGTNGNVKYVISSLRQQMIAYDCRLQEKPEAADYIVEGRVGVLANDGHELTYGIPGGAAAVSATALLATPMPPPAMPELSLGRRNHQAGTAKIGLFAYDRLTREPVWQAGVKKGTSNVCDTWFLGLGPYQNRPQRRQNSPSSAPEGENRGVAQDPMAAYQGTVVFERAGRTTLPAATQAEIATANLEVPVEPQPLPGAGAAAKPLKALR